MNAEYESHKRVWEMLKPREFAQLESSQPRRSNHPLASVPVSESLDGFSVGLDLALLAHGRGELASPLAEW